ncbi:MAG: galactitol-1-phosphate 5-dehydrogenase [Leucobacter sp.]
MTAAVLYEPGDIRVEEVPIPAIGSEDLLVEVAACGVCGSDIPRMMSTGAYYAPIICGHEFAGHVVEVGDAVTGFAVGDLVTVPPLLPCRECESCREGHFSLCADYDYFGSRREGAYARYVNVPVGNALLMPEGLDPRAAAMIDPAAIALHALLKTDLAEGDRVAVLGAGPIGLFAVEWALLRGASEVLALDVSEEKAAMARQAGATLTATSGEQALELAGTGFDVLIETAGVPPTIALAPDLLARHGRAAFIGIPHSPIELGKKTFSNFLRREISLHGSWNSFSAPFPGYEWTESAARLADGSLGWEFMITHELGLNALPETMRQLADRSIFSSKVLFVPSKS